MTKPKLNLSVGEISVLDEISVTRLACGMTVLVQPMPWLRTAAFSLALPAGVSSEPDDRGGLASMVCEMVQRGAGTYSSRDLVAVQDNLGMDRNGGVSIGTTSFGCAMPAQSLREALSIYADIVRRPHLPADQLDDAKMMGLQELRALADEPTHRVMSRLRQRQYGPHLGRSSHGTAAGLESIDEADVRDFFANHYHGGDAIVGIAGNVDPNTVIEMVDQCFGDWKQLDAPELPAPDGSPGYEHIESPSAQTHIGFSFDTIPYGHRDYFAMRAGIGILSDGMSSRLFDRVREQRGLCYTVSASVQNLPHTAAVMGYAGTTPARAQETLDVTMGEIASVTDGLSVDELDRWKVRIESSLVMEQESSGSRASSLVADQMQIGRPQSTDELRGLIESLTIDKVRDYWDSNPPSGYRIVTLGESPLVV